MKPRIWLGLFGLLLVAALIWMAMGDGGDAPPDAPATGAATDAPPNPARKRSRAQGRGAADPEPEADPAEPPPAPDPDAKWPIRVRTNVPGATVTVTFRHVGGEPDPEPLTKTADESGFVGFRQPDHPEPLYRATAIARAEGHKPARDTVRDGEAVLELDPWFRIGGIVRGRAGEAVEGARVNGGRGATGVSGADGAFELWVPATNAVRLGATHSAYRAAGVEVVAPADNVVITMDPGLQVSGRVHFPDLTPVPGAWLQVHRAHGFALAETDKDGRYVLSGLPEREVDVFCVAPRTRTSRKVVAGATDVDFVMPHHAIRVRLVDEQDRPFRNAFLMAKGMVGDKTTFTSAGDGGETGVHTYAARPGEHILISPSAPGYVDQVTEIVVDGDPRFHDVKIVMRRPGATGAISIRALDEHGSPLGNVLFTLENLAGSSVEGYFDKLVELSAGRGRVDGIPVGRYRVKLATSKSMFSVEGYGLPTRSDVTVETGLDAEVEAVVFLGGRLEVSVENAAGEPAPARRLALIDGDGKRVSLVFMRRTEDGGWTTDLEKPGTALTDTPLPPGNYRLEVRHGDEVVATREIAIQPGETTRTTIRLP